MPAPSSPVPSRDPCELMRETATRIAWLWLDRADTGNRLSHEVVDALHAALEQVEACDDIDVLVLAARGGVFCRGCVEPAEAAPLPPLAHRAEVLATSDLMLRLAALPCITLAAIAGDVAGAGIELVASCDFAIAGSSARFAVPDLDHGRWPHTTQVALSRAMAPRQALALLLDTRARDAAEMARLGLLHEVVADAELESRTRALAATLAGKPAALIAPGKQSFHRQLAMNRADAYLYAVEQQTRNPPAAETGNMGVTERAGR